MDLSTNTPENQGEITRDAADHFGVPIEDVETVYEHGQWRVILIEDDPNHPSPLTYSVVETNDGLDYEEV